MGRWTSALEQRLPLTPGLRQNPRHNTSQLLPQCHSSSGRAASQFASRAHPEGLVGKRAARPGLAPESTLSVRAVRGASLTQQGAPGREQQPPNRVAPGQPARSGCSGYVSPGSGSLLRATTRGSAGSACCAAGHTITSCSCSSQQGAGRAHAWVLPVSGRAEVVCLAPQHPSLPLQGQPSMSKPDSSVAAVGGVWCARHATAYRPVCCQQDRSQAHCAHRQRWGRLLTRALTVCARCCCCVVGPLLLLVQASAPVDSPAATWISQQSSQS